MKKKQSAVSGLRKFIIAVVTAAFLISALQICLFNCLKEPIQYKATGSFNAELTGSAENISIRFTPTGNLLSQISVVFASVPEKANPDIVDFSISRDGKLLYHSTLPMADIKANQWIRFNISQSLKPVPHTMQIKADPSARLYFCDTENGPETLISYGYQPNLDGFEKTWLVLFLATCWGVICCLILRWNRVKAALARFINTLQRNFNVLKPYSLVNAFFAWLGLSFSGLDLDTGTQAFFTLISFLAAIWVQSHPADCKMMLASKAKRALLAFLTIWTAFALVGNLCFVFPLDKHMTISSVLCFLITILWLAPVILCAVYALDWHGENCLKSVSGRNMPVLLIAACAFIFVMGALFYARAFNPCVSTADTEYCMNLAIGNMHGMQNWHPPFYIAWLKVILRICESISAILFVQYGFFFYVYMRGMNLLYKHGLSGRWIIGSTLFFTLNSSHMLQLATIWKDIPYMIVLLWLTVIIAQLLIDGGGWYTALELIVALVCVYCFRQNGIVPYLMVSVALLVFFRRRLKTVLAVVLAFLLILAIQFPLYSYLDVKDGPIGGKYIGLGQDLINVYYNGGHISENTMDIVLFLARNDISGYTYSPYWASSSYELDVSVPEFIGAYINTFLRNPVLMTKAILVRQDAAWNIFMNRDGTRSCLAAMGTKDNDKEWTDNWPRRIDNYFTERATESVEYSRDTSLVHIFEWRSGLWMISFLICLSVLLAWKRRPLLLLTGVPFLGQFISLLLSTGWDDVRYYWPFNVIGLFLILFTCTVQKQKEEQVQ